ncbi:response regulator [Myxococcota bacterium]|nr:response regulator [Myxococcota bacterium]
MSDKRPPPEGRSGDLLRILLIDDQEELREILRQTLASRGYGVDSVASGTEGIERLRRGGIGIVLADLGLPDASGWEVAATAKALCASTAVVLMTIWSGEVDPRSLRAHGVDLMLPKPFRSEELLRAMERVATPRPHPGPPIAAGGLATPDLL